MLAAVGEQSDKPLVSTFLGAEGVPELLRVPDVAGSTAGRGSVPSYPAVEAAVRALARVVEYAVWLRTPDGAAPDPDAVDPAAAQQVIGRALAASPDGVDLDDDAADRAARGVRHRAVGGPARRVTARGRRRPAGSWAGTSSSRPPPSTCASGRTSPTCGATSTRPRRCATPGRPCSSSSASPSEAGFVVQKNAPPGVPVAIRSLEDPLFGPVVSFGISGPIIELLADVSYRIPPICRARRGRRWCARSSSSPMLFGYRGSEVVDVDEVERLIQRVAQLQNDLPQVRALELSLVLAGAARRDRADRRGPGRAGRRPALGLVRPPDAARSRVTPSRARA